MKYNLEWLDEGAIEVCKLKEEFVLTTTTQVDNLSKLSQTLHESHVDVEWVGQAYQTLQGVRSGLWSTLEMLHFLPTINPLLTLVLRYISTNPRRF